MGIPRSCCAGRNTPRCTFVLGTLNETVCPGRPWRGRKSRLWSPQGVRRWVQGKLLITKVHCSFWRARYSAGTYIMSPKVEKALGFC